MPAWPATRALSSRGSTSSVVELLPKASHWTELATRHLPETVPTAHPSKRTTIDADAAHFRFPAVSAARRQELAAAPRRERVGRDYEVERDSAPKERFMLTPPPMR